MQQVEIQRFENNPQLLKSLKGLSGKVAIYGGTFDPIHNGDLAVIKTAQEKHNFDQIILIPTAQNPNKAHRPKATDQQRLTMVLDAVEDLEYVKVCPAQLVDEVSNYTSELLSEISENGTDTLDLHFLMGADNLEDLPAWRDPEQMLKLAKCTVINRPGYEFDRLLGDLRGKFDDDVLDGIAERVVRSSNSPFSSTGIRNKFAEGEIPSRALPGKVLTYIQEQGLYQPELRSLSAGVKIGDAERRVAETATQVSKQLEQTKESFKVGISQRKFRATRFDYNFEMICRDIDAAEEQGVQRLVFPELTIPGYMSLDMFQNKAYIQKNLEMLQKVIDYTKNKNVVVIIGYARPGEEKANGQYALYNSAAVIRGGVILDTIDKTLLPAGDIFWERRYFENGNNIHVTEIDGVKEGVLICEDLWDQDHSTRVAGELKQQGAERLWALNASPFYTGKGDLRHTLFSSKAKTLGVPIAYANLVGSQDGYHGEVLFDGRSMIYDHEGRLTGLAETFSEELLVVDMHDSAEISVPSWNAIEEIHDGIVMGFQDYFERFGLKKAVIGISGGLDSALVAYFACKALGSDRVTGITMPMDGVTGSDTYGDAYKLADNLGFELKEIPIRPVWEAQEEALREEAGASTGWRRKLRQLFSFIPGVEPEPDPINSLTKENMQARVRGSLLMNYSNNHPGDAVICPSNETEFWNFTMYGDSNGAFKPLGNIDKSTLFALAEIAEGVPDSIRTRPPTAELMTGQTDRDVLPEDFDVMSPLMRQVITPQITRAELIKAWEAELGDRTEAVIDETIRKVRGSRQGFGKEWAHRQVPPAFRVTKHAVGAGRRVPYDNTFGE